MKFNGRLCFSALTPRLVIYVLDWPLYSPAICVSSEEQAVGYDVGASVRSDGIRSARPRSKSRVDERVHAIAAVL